MISKSLRIRLSIGLNLRIKKINITENPIIEEKQIITESMSKLLIYILK